MRNAYPGFTNGRAPFVLSFIAGLLIGGQSTAESTKPELRLIQASDPEAMVALLSAPHTGSVLCEIEDQSPVQFLRQVNHGPHKFAEVAIREGTCAGKIGFVALLYLKSFN